MNLRTILVAASSPLVIALAGASMLACCVPAHAAAAAPCDKPTPDKHIDDASAHIYRLDFVVTSNEAGAPAVKQAVVLNVADRHHGDVSVGHNVPLQTGSGLGPQTPRTDVGLRLAADCASSGDDVLLQVRLEASDVEPAPVGAAVPLQKATASGEVLAKLGQPTLVLRVDDGHKQYEVTVTATRVR
jgi:hypothetical protein